MIITLKQQHIEAAIKAYVAKAGIAFPIEEVNFTAGRGKDGMTATIEMQDPFAELLDAAIEPEPAKKETTKKAETKKKESRAEPEPAQDKDEDEDEDALVEEQIAAEKPSPFDEAPPFSAEEEESMAPAKKEKKEKTSLFS